MPTYEYHCKSCKAVYELRQGFDAATTHKCEECGKGTAKRVLHAPPVVFKGGGWYVTDSRNSKSAVTDSDTTSTPSTPEPASTGKADTTSTTASESAAAS